MKIGVTAGAFDLTHAGHMLMFKDCKNVCDYLIVLLQTDPSIDRAWKNKPVQSVEERLIMLEGNKYIDEIVLYTKEQEMEDWLIANKHRLHVRILGSDYINNTGVVGYNVGIPIHYHDRNHSWSSSNLRHRVYEAEKNKQ